MKSPTSTPVVDDVESKAAEHQMIMKNYNGATKTTLQRGKEKPLGWLVLSKNYTEDEIVLEKDDNGRIKCDVYDKKVVEDTDDAYDQK